MLKFLITTAPYILKAQSRSSQKKIARSVIAIGLFALSGLMFSIAAYIYVSSIYGAAIGCVSISALFLVIGLMFYFKAKTSKRMERDTKISHTTPDPIAALLPDSVMKDPAVSKLLGQVTANPITTSLAAAAIGMLITREIMKD